MEQLTVQNLYEDLSNARDYTEIYTTFNDSEYKFNDLYIIKDGYVKDLKDLNGLELVDSGYGDLVRKETMYDKNVRNSKEIDAKYVYRKNIKGNYIHISNILDHIKNTVSKFTQSEVTIVPYKFINYGPGSFFKPHVDSLKDKNNIGTVIVSLSSDYEGGQFVIGHKNKEHEFTLKESEVIFFYGSCPHEVKPVTKGNRFVLTFDVYATKNLDSISSLLNTDIETKLYTFFRNLKTCVQTEGKGLQLVCIELDHKYHSGFPNDECDDNIEGYEPDELKGFDKVMYEYLKTVLIKTDPTLAIFMKNKHLRHVENVLRIKKLTDREHNDYSGGSKMNVPSAKNIWPSILGYKYYTIVDNPKERWGSNMVCSRCLNSEEFLDNSLDENSVEKYGVEPKHGRDCYMYSYDDDKERKCSDDDTLLISSSSNWNYEHYIKKDDYGRYESEEETEESEDDDSDSDRNTVVTANSSKFYIGNQHCNEYYSYGKVFMVITKEHLMKMNFC